MKPEELLKIALEKRSHLFNDPQTTCFRIFNTAGDGIDGFTIDLYGEYLLVQYFREEAGEDNIDLMKAVEELAAALPVPVRGILLKSRVVLKGNLDYAEMRKSRLLAGEEPPEGYCVRQNGVLAAVDLVEGQSTGVFLDMRTVRDTLASFYRENSLTSMVNFFSYTALFSVHALKNGVKQAINVDLSKAVLKKARSNYLVNDLKDDDRDFIYGDSLDWIRRFDKNKREFSFAVFDPPTFSRHKKRSFSVKKDYSQSLMFLEKIVPQGYVLTSINSYSVAKDEYLSYHPKSWELVFFENESSDFIHNSNPYLKVGLWKCSSNSGKNA
ncbi:MAG: class I SAM-dependent rRNA methyltransferase [bacterium]|nr:class I SAM-dependent rRNA methyltransferase [bacterium]